MRKCRGRSKVWVLKSSPWTDAIPVQATKSMTQGRKKRQLIDSGSQGGGIAPSAILGGGKPLQIHAGVMCRTRFQGTGQPKAVSLFRTENMKGRLYKNLCTISLDLRRRMEQLVKKFHYCVSVVQLSKNLLLTPSLWRMICSKSETSRQPEGRVI